MIRPIKKSVAFALKCVSFAMSCIMFSGKFATNWRAILQSDVLLVYHQGGFGHTIHGPDLVRRLFPGQRIVVLYMRQGSIHNPLVARIWPDIDMVFLPIEFVWRQRPRQWRMPWFLCLKSEWLAAAMKRLFKGKTVLTPTDLYSLACRESDHAQTGPVATEYLPAYYRLLSRVPAVSPRLPADWKRQVEQRLVRHAAKYQKMCCLYLRAKGDAGGLDSSSRRRIGSPIQNYWAAMKILNARGYLILLVGDRRLESGDRLELGDGVVDAAALGLSDNLLYLYAALSCDIAVLECGGGRWLPTYRHIPHLVVNAFPFGFTSDGGTIYYKSVVGSDGTALDPRLLFGPMSQKYDFDSARVEINTGEELAEAIADFLDHLNGPQPWGIPASLVAELPPASLHRAVHSAISPVWLRRYGTSFAFDRPGQTAGSDGLFA